MQAEMTLDSEMTDDEAAALFPKLNLTSFDATPEAVNERAGGAIEAMNWVIRDLKRHDQECRTLHKKRDPVMVVNKLLANFILECEVNRLHPNRGGVADAMWFVGLFAMGIVLGLTIRGK